jgi:hypothetical protein
MIPCCNLRKKRDSRGGCNHEKCFEFFYNRRCCSHSANATTSDCKHPTCLTYIGECCCRRQQSEDIPYDPEMPPYEPKDSSCISCGEGFNTETLLICGHTWHLTCLKTFIADEKERKPKDFFAFAKCSCGKILSVADYCLLNSDAIFNLKK